MKLTVVLGPESSETFDINLYKNKFVTKWTEELKWCLDNCEFNQLEAFAGFLSLAESETILKNACLTINKYLKNFIEIRSDFVSQPQEYFNYLHSKFEQLSGEFGKPTRLFSIAKSDLKQAIRALNFFIHRIERKQEFSNGLYVSFDKDQYRRHKLTEEDYNYFEFKLPAGTLYLHYVELGKELFDLYQDSLPLDYKNFKNLHYYSGEAGLTFTDIDCFKDENYVKWLQANNFDHLDKTIGHGKIPIGYVDDVQSVIDKLNKNRYIKDIIIKD
jgi:hypothetical protein